MACASTVAGQRRPLGCLDSTSPHLIRGCAFEILPWPRDSTMHAQQATPAMVSRAGLTKGSLADLCSLLGLS